MKILQRKRPQPEAATDSPENQPIQPMNDDIYMQAYGQKRNQRFQQQIEHVPVQQQNEAKTRAQKIEEQLRNQPSFDMAVVKQRPVATTRTGLKPRILQNNNLDKQKFNPPTFRQNVAANKNENDVTIEQEEHSQQPFVEIAASHYQPAVQNPVFTPEDLINNARKKNYNLNAKNTEHIKPVESAKVTIKPNIQKQKQPKSQHNNAQTNIETKQPQIEQETKQSPDNRPTSPQKPIYYCKSCKTPLINLTFLKGEAVNSADLMCAICSDKKYKEIQLLQLRLINERKLQTNNQLMQIDTKIVENKIEISQQQNAMQQQINQSVNAQQQLKQQILQLESKLVNSVANAESEKQLIELKQQIQQLATKLNDKNDEIAKMKQEMQATQKQEIKELSLSSISETQKPNEAEIYNKNAEMMQLKQQVNMISAQLQQIQDKPAGYQKETISNDVKHEHPTQQKQNKLLHIMQQMNEQVLQNFPFIIRKKVCSICGEVLGMQIIDPRDNNTNVSEKKLDQTIKLQKQLQESHLDVSEDQLYEMLKKKRSEKKSSDADVYDYNKIGDEEKRRKLDQLFRIDEKLAQIQIHTNSNQIEKLGILEQPAKELEQRIDKAKEEMFFGVQNEVQKTSLNEIEASEDGDLQFGGRRRIEF